MHCDDEAGRCFHSRRDHKQPPRESPVRVKSACGLDSHPVSRLPIVLQSLNGAVEPILELLSTRNTLHESIGSGTASQRKCVEPQCFSVWGLGFHGLFLTVVMLVKIVCEYIGLPERMRQFQDTIQYTILYFTIVLVSYNVLYDPFPYCNISYDVRRFRL